jgi:7-keto-8-aminopelargonate synthetase-like enzyme
VNWAVGAAMSIGGTLSGTARVVQAILDSRARLCAWRSLPPVASAPSRADPNPASIEADDVAELQLPSASAIDLAVHGHKAVDDGLFHVSTGVEESSEFQELAEPNDLATDRDVVDGRWIRHPRTLADRSRLLGRPSTAHRDPTSTTRVF